MASKKPKKRCTRCGEEKPLEGFHHKSTSKDGHDNRCKECRKRPKSIPNQPLREAFEASGLTATELAWRLGYSRKNGRWRRADASPVRIVLGLKPKARSNGGGFQTHMHEPTAVRYAKALNLDPHEIGL